MMDKRTWGACMMLAVLFCAIPAYAWFKVVRVCDNVNLPNNAATNCAVADLQGAEWVASQIECHNNSTVAISVSSDFKQHQSGTVFSYPSWISHTDGSSVVTHAGHLNDSISTEGAWSSAVGLMVPPMERGTLILTNHVDSTATTVTCTADLLLRGN